MTKRSTLFAWLISHQPAVLFSQNKPATSNQSAVLSSRTKSTPATSHQPNEQAVQFETKEILDILGIFYFSLLQIWLVSFLEKELTCQKTL
jgi:hypothetical protein